MAGSRVTKQKSGRLAQGGKEIPLFWRCQARAPNLCANLLPPRESCTFGVKRGLLTISTPFQLSISQKKQFKGSMVKWVLCFVLAVSFAALATAAPQQVINNYKISVVCIKYQTQSVYFKTNIFRCLSHTRAFIPALPSPPEYVHIPCSVTACPTNIFSGIRNCWLCLSFCLQGLYL